MAAVVLRLCEITGLFGSGRIVCADSAFGGFELSRALWERKLYSILAIKARRAWPKHTNGGEFVAKVTSMAIGGAIARVGYAKEQENYKFFIAGMSIPFH